MDDSLNTTPLLSIDKLNIRLPVGFEKRADSIARNLAKQLAHINIDISSDRNIASLSLPNLRVSSGEANTVIARRLAQSIATNLHGNQKNSAAGVKNNVD